ncbi:MAG: membrane protein insertase YidC [Sphingomonadales bacterium]|nr:membrane protein insertase YidC [Sphingomonadales bacterium]
MTNQRNLIIWILLTVVLLFGWEAGMRHFYPNAYKAKPKPAVSAPATPGGEPVQAAKPTREGGLSSDSDKAIEAQDLKTALASPSRVPVAAPGLSGSINLAGALIDDLVANRHTAAVDSKDPARIYSPSGTPAQQFAQVGWVGQNIALPGADTLWTAPAGAKLTPETPVTLTWDNGQGQTFAITYAIDKDYMLTATQTVRNAGTAPVSVTPFAQINRTDRTASLDSWNIHSGPFGAFDGSVKFDPNYKNVREAGQLQNEGKADWVGFTDVYWMSALIPGTPPASSDFRSLGNGIYRADVIYKAASVAPGQQAALTTRLFAGAKESLVLDAYEKAGITNFGHAIDWGWFFWFEKPIFWLLRSLFHFAGNFGVAIILLTLIVRGIMFPVAQRQFASMAAMKAIQPKMKALQERYKDDKQKIQEETMKLYKSEGVNPLAGCLPIFLQIPVFFALYKVLMVSIEMRHQPFILWIKDLSAPDPLHILNLFGLLHFTPPAFLGIGVLALLLGITMYFQFKLNPAQMDPAQQQIFAIMPWMMMFIMAPFAAGLLIYWITSNILTIAQQKFLYSRHPALGTQTDKEADDAKRAKH